MGFRHVGGATLALFGTMLVGCADKNAATPPPAMAPYAAAQAPVAAAPPAGAIDTAGLHVSDVIAQACGLPRTESAPKFAFDSATIADEDRTILAAIAKCVSEGALRGQALSLIGRADPRGENEYNMSLGESRADSVRRYLHDLGVHPDKVKATSRGEIDAIGNDEASWAQDRRVDIELATR
jgi:peptidoglycan-associated lipoprotein